MSMTAAQRRYQESPRGRAKRREARRRRYEHHLRRVEAAKAGGCIDCGTHADLHFHHLDPSLKRYNLHSMYTCSDVLFATELAKCVVLCEGCHVRRHHG